MAVVIRMNKVSESEQAVRYTAEIDVPVDPYLASNGKQRWKLETKKGVFEFSIASEKITFFSGESDPVFLQSEAHQSRCWKKMMDCKRGGAFPEKVMWAS